jgi:hypothetical protein
MVTGTIQTNTGAIRPIAAAAATTTVAVAAAMVRLGPSPAVLAARFSAVR